MKTIEVRLMGVTPIIFSRMTEEDAAGIETGVKRPIVPGRDEKEEAGKRLWKQDDKSGIPFHMLFACLAEAGRKVKNGRNNITGTRGTTLTDFLMLKGDFFPFEDGSTWEPRKDMVKQVIRGSSIARPAIRPMFKIWSFVVEAEFDDTIIAQETLRALFDAAGRVGMGAWRPSSPKPGPFGKFQVEKWKVDGKTESVATSP